MKCSLCLSPSIYNQQNMHSTTNVPLPNISRHQRIHTCVHQKVGRLEHIEEAEREEQQKRCWSRPPDHRGWPATPENLIVAGEMVHSFLHNLATAAQVIKQQQQEGLRPHPSSSGGACDSDPHPPCSSRADNPGDTGHGGGACHSRAPGSNASDSSNNSSSKVLVTLEAQAVTTRPPEDTSGRDCIGWKVPTP